MRREIVWRGFWPALHVARRYFPTTVRARLRQFLFQWLDIKWPLPTGVHIRVDDYGDWAVYNEIFVNGEYDEALDRALGSAEGEALQIADLGANHGFFTLRAVDALRRRGFPPDSFTITAVEASPRCCRAFEARVFRENGLAGRVRLVHGAVGERTGASVLDEDSGASARLGRPEKARVATVPVPYVDLSVLFAPSERIDLLKCDIEGSELAFIENYADVLRKVRVAVFELHTDLCDVDRCQALLRDCGLVHQTSNRSDRREGNFILLAWR